jgi:hypothetical protein
LPLRNHGGVSAAGYGSSARRPRRDRSRPLAARRRCGDFRSRRIRRPRSRCRSSRPERPPPRSAENGRRAPPALPRVPGSRTRSPSVVPSAHPPTSSASPPDLCGVRNVRPANVSHTARAGGS